jgi:threonylcarbamoyladenosine tRNA methylthiotransferase MtaB
MEDVLSEVRDLTDAGCREVVLTGIETASWGRDLGDVSLADLLEAVDAIPGIGRVRLGSLDPTLMRPAFVERIAKLSSLAPHFHLSMQSGSDAVLARMKRKYNRTQALAAIERLHSALPDVMLTTDIIVGFPGETEEDFEATMDLARRARFLMIHVFPYSKRQGTPAAVMPDQVPGEIKKQRVAALSALSADIRREILTGLIEKKTILPVLFETYTEGTAVGHTPNFIEVHVPVPTSLHAQTHNVRLVALTEDGTGCIGQLC